MNLLEIKIVVIILLLVAKSIAGLAPLLFRKVKQRRKILDKFVGGILCLGGGVLLSTVFVHILPEVREGLERSSFFSKNFHFPLGEIIICTGFFLIYSIETLVQLIFGIKGEHSHGPMGHDNPTFVEEEKQHSSIINSTVTPQLKESKWINKTESNIYNVSSATLTSYTSYSDNLDEQGSLPHLVNKSSKNKNNSKVLKERKIVISIRNILFVLALSIHSVFEGMAIGLQQTSSDVWKLFGAVTLHECAILFCIGTEMIFAGTKKLQIIIYMISLSLITPFGVIIGVIITESSSSESSSQILVIAVLQGLAGGTVLYITFFEVLSREKLSKTHMNGIIGCFILIFGFTIMTLLEVTGGHSHEHSNNESSHDHPHHPPHYHHHHKDSHDQHIQIPQTIDYILNNTMKVNDNFVNDVSQKFDEEDHRLKNEEKESIQEITF